jgi:hypothetical protein
MTEKEQEFDELIRKAAQRGTKGCKCLEAMLAGYRKPYYQDDGCIYVEPEPRRKEPKKG